MDDSFEGISPTKRKSREEISLLEIIIYLWIKRDDHNPTSGVDVATGKMQKANCRMTIEVGIQKSGATKMAFCIVGSKS